MSGAPGSALAALREQVGGYLGFVAVQDPELGLWGTSSG